MKGMLIKDFSLLKGQKQFFIVAFMFAFIFMFISDMATFGVAYLIVMFVFFTLSTIAYDEYDNGNAFLFTLPISRRGYVREKYLFGILASGLIVLIDIVLIMMMTYVKGGGKEQIETLMMTAAGALVAGMVMIAIVIPLQLKLGSEKRQMAMVAGFVVFFFLIYCGKELTERFGVPGFVKMIGNLSMGSVIAIIAVVIVAIGVISYQISVHIMEKKEL